MLKKCAGSSAGESAGALAGGAWEHGPAKREDREEMEDHFNSGWIDFGVAGTEAVPATMTPKEFFAGL